MQKIEPVKTKKGMIHFKNDGCPEHTSFVYFKRMIAHAEAEIKEWEKFIKLVEKKTEAKNNLKK